MNTGTIRAGSDGLVPAIDIRARLGVVTSLLRPPTRPSFVVVDLAAPAGGPAA
jgi:hypothetical protein